MKYCKRAWQNLFYQIIWTLIKSIKAFDINKVSLQIATLPNAGFVINLDTYYFHSWLNEVLCLPLSWFVGIETKLLTDCRENGAIITTWRELMATHYNINNALCLQIQEEEGWKKHVDQFLESCAIELKEIQAFSISNINFDGLMNLSIRHFHVGPKGAILWMYPVCLSGLTWD